MDNKTSILACAVQAFADRGYHAVGIQEIVEAAGITKPTLYHYFGSKQGLLETLLQESFQQLFQKVSVAACYQGDLPLSLYRVIRTYFEFARQNPDFYRMQMSMVYAPVDSVPAQAMFLLNQQQHQILEKLFVAATEDHGNMKCRHQIYAATLLGAINTYIGLFFIGSIKLDEEAIYQASHQFMHGIYS